MTKRKGKNWRCDCGEGFNSEAEIIKHYRKEHHTNPSGLMNITDSCGDKFADGIINRLKVQNLAEKGLNLKLTNELTKIKADYDMLNFCYNQMIKAGMAAMNSISAAKDAIDHRMKQG